MKSLRRSFTLIELIVAVIVLGVIVIAALTGIVCLVLWLCGVI